MQRLKQHGVAVALGMAGFFAGWLMLQGVRAVVRDHTALGDLIGVVNYNLQQGRLVLPGPPPPAPPPAQPPK